MKTNTNIIPTTSLKQNPTITTKNVTNCITHTNTTKKRTNTASTSVQPYGKNKTTYQAPYVKSAIVFAFSLNDIIKSHLPDKKFRNDKEKIEIHFAQKLIGKIQLNFSELVLTLIYCNRYLRYCRKYKLPMPSSPGSVFPSMTHMVIPCLILAEIYLIDCPHNSRWWANKCSGGVTVENINCWKRDVLVTIKYWLYVEATKDFVNWKNQVKKLALNLFGQSPYSNSQTIKVKSTNKSESSEMDISTNTNDANDVNIKNEDTTLTKANIDDNNTTAMDNVERTSSSIKKTDSSQNKNIHSSSFRRSINIHTKSNSLYKYNTNNHDSLIQNSISNNFLNRKSNTNNTDSILTDASTTALLNMINNNANCKMASPIGGITFKEYNVRDSTKNKSNANTNTNSDNNNNYNTNIKMSISNIVNNDSKTLYNSDLNNYSKSQFKNNTSLSSTSAMYSSNENHKSFVTSSNSIDIRRSSAIKANSRFSNNILNQNNANKYILDNYELMCNKSYDENSYSGDSDKTKVNSIYSYINNDNNNFDNSIRNSLLSDITHVATMAYDSFRAYNEPSSTTITHSSSNASTQTNASVIHNNVNSYFPLNSQSSTSLNYKGSNGDSIENSLLSNLGLSKSYISQQQQSLKESQQTQQTSSFRVPTLSKSPFQSITNSFYTQNNNSKNVVRLSSPEAYIKVTSNQNSTDVSQNNYEVTISGRSFSDRSNINSSSNTQKYINGFIAPSSSIDSEKMQYLPHHGFNPTSRFKEEKSPPSPN